MKTRLQLTGLLLVATAVAAAEMRTWTFEESGKTTQAEVVAFAGDAVTLRGADGKTYSVPIAYFSKSDRVYLAAERAKQWKEVEVIKLEVGESAGRDKKCTVRGKSLNGEIFVELLPPAVEAILNNRNQQAAQITNLSAQIESQNIVVQQATAAIPTGTSGSLAYRRAVAAQRAQVNLAAKQLKDARANLAKLQKSYDDYVKKTKDQTVVKMRDTGVVYKRLPLWECFDPRKPQH